MTTEATRGTAPTGPSSSDDVEGGSADEVRVNAFFDHATASPHARNYALGHVRETLGALLAIRRLPVLTAELTRDGDGPEVYWPLRRAPHSRALMAGVTAVLQLPDTAEEYVTGASKQTLRRKARMAVKAGVTWAEVTDPAVRADLLAQVFASEQRNPEQGAPLLDGLLGIGLWLVAYDRDGQVLLVSITPVDSGWAVLRYFRTLVSNEDASVARYYMTQILVEHLIDRKVRYLADSLSPLRLPPGIRHFQRMLGYRLVRVRLRRR